MSGATSVSTRKRYGLQRVCKAWEIARSTVYHYRRAPEQPGPKGKRGPQPDVSDEQALELIRQTLKDSPFTGEGHRKVHARIRRQPDSAPLGRDRVRRLMRDHGLLSPYRRPQGKAKSHDGKIVTGEPNVMWATDAAKILTVDNGWVWFFGVLDHWNSECLGWHLAKVGDRFAAIEALGRAVEVGAGSRAAEAARGVKLRMDHGSQFKSDAFLNQIRYWGIAPSFGFVKEPETNGVIERFHRTLKEQVIHGRVYRDIEELREAISRFVEAYNESWLLEKLGYLSPRHARARWEVRDAA